MKKKTLKLVFMMLFMITMSVEAETISYPDSAYSGVSTYMNPIIQSDFPDITLFKDGNDFYACGSSFHFTPYCAIYHSTDLVHWEVISRAVQPTWSGLVSDAPGNGLWEGAITKFYGSYWLYFSNTASGGQYFSKANSLYGPWSTPVKVKTTATTGPIGYDNSIFVDDDGTPYMLIKNGKFTNKIQQVGHDGHLTGDAINLEWINRNGKYSWAEGPVMCKRDGWYYYLIAGNVAGGQWALRTKDLHADSTQWQELGKFFADVTDRSLYLGSPNHASQPFELADGTWWCLSHCYEKSPANDWSGKGRQCMLHQVTWDENGKPTASAAASSALLAPRLQNSGIHTCLPSSDAFSQSKLNLCWYFLNAEASKHYSLTSRKGWLRLNPDSGSAHLLQKDAAHYSTVMTHLDVNPKSYGEEAGLYITNGNESSTVALVSCFHHGKKIAFRFGSTVFMVNNIIGNDLWLKLIRKEHQIEGLYSKDNSSWISLGSVDVTSLDLTQSNYNSWVGNSNGLYAKHVTADFDSYCFKDGFTEQPAISYLNAFGVATKTNTFGKTVGNTTNKGGWFMLGGLDLGAANAPATAIEVSASATEKCSLEIWIDDIGRKGYKIATVKIPSGKVNGLTKIKAAMTATYGQHDVYIKYNCPSGTADIYSVKFGRKSTVSAISKK
jgi:beta-xylosidase